MQKETNRPGWQKYKADSENSVAAPASKDKTDSNSVDFNNASMASSPLLQEAIEKVRKDFTLRSKLSNSLWP